MKQLFANDKYRAILSKGSLSFFMMSFGLAIGYLLILTLAYFLGAEGVGIYSLFVSIVTLIGTFAALGLGFSTLRFVGELKANNNEGALTDLYNKMLLIVIPVAVVTSVVLYFLKSYFAALFNIDSQSLLNVAIIIAIPFFAVYLVNIRFLQALNEIKLFEFFRSIYRPLSITVLTVVVINYFTDVLLPVWFYVIATGLATIFLTLLIYKKLDALKTDYYENINFKQILSVSLPLMLVSFGSILMAHIDNIMIGYFMNTEAVGIYAVAFKIAYVASLVLIAINTVMASKISEQYYSKDITSLKKSIHFATTIVALGTFPIVLIIIIFPEYLLMAFGDEFTVGSTVLIYIAVGQLINALSGSVGILLSVTGHQVVVRNIIWITVIINVSLNYTLIPIYGIEGAAIATAISLAFQNIIMVLFAYKKLGINTFFNFRLRF